MIRKKSLFYILSFTWGITMTIIGCFVAVGLIMTKHKPQKYGYCYRFEVAKGWGGVNFGPFIVTNIIPSNHTMAHECGHALQNCRFGPFMVVIGLMSVCRYWYREFKYYKRGLTPSTVYDDAWYEGHATKIGTAFINWYDAQ